MVGRTWKRIDEVFDPEKAINRAIEYYRKKGYDDEWIKRRLDSILNRKNLQMCGKNAIIL